VTLCPLNAGSGMGKEVFIKILGGLFPCFRYNPTCMKFAIFPRIVTDHSVYERFLCWGEVVLNFFLLAKPFSYMVVNGFPFGSVIEPFHGFLGHFIAAMASDGSLSFECRTMLGGYDMFPVSIPFQGVSINQIEGVCLVTVCS